MKRNRIGRILIPVLAIAAILAAAPSAAAAADNLILNPSFEENTDGIPSNWSASAWINDANATVFTYEAGGRSGNAAAAVENKAANDARYTQAVAVEPDSYYLYSGWVETYGVGENGIGANISVYGKFEMSQQFKGDNKDWQYMELYIRTYGDAASVTVTVGVGGYGQTNTGKAWFDDLSLVKVDAIPDGAIFTSVGTKPTGVKDPAKIKATPASATLEGPGIVLWVVLGLAILTIFAGYAFYLIKFPPARPEAKAKTEK
jgi:hypothetical protein